MLNGTKMITKPSYVGNCSIFSHDQVPDWFGILVKNLRHWHLHMSAQHTVSYTHEHIHTRSLFNVTLQIYTKPHEVLAAVYRVVGGKTTASVLLKKCQWIQTPPQIICCLFSRSCASCSTDTGYDCTIMEQPEAGMGNHSKVITGQKYSTPVSAFPSIFPLNTRKCNFNITDYSPLRQQNDITYGSKT